MPTGTTTTSRRAAWTLLLLLLLALRVPSLAQPAGGDQGLYLFEGQQLLGGAVPYRDVWDQKPPGIAGVSALLWRIWPHQSVVAAADLAAAGLTAWLLVTLGRRIFGGAAGWMAAAAFLFFGDPSFTGAGGMYVRAQCETFIALAVTLALVVNQPARRPGHAVLAGAMLGLAFWLKYNALAYIVPMIVAAWVRPVSEGGRPRDLTMIAVGFAAVVAIGLTYFAMHGGLTDLRLATFDYNLRYSSETYAGPGATITYLAALPFVRAHVHFLWFLGGVGVVLLVIARAPRGALAVTLAWLAAAMVSIAVNGARELPQYFVQAGPPLALAAGGGLAALAGRSQLLRVLAGLVMLIGLWRVGADAPGPGGFRWAGLPGYVDTVRGDLERLRGRSEPRAYLSRFTRAKHDPADIEDIARYAASTTAPADRVFGFGFSGGAIGASAVRPSASRFFWCRPVIVEFAGDRPGYGSAGLLDDLRARAPVLVVLQKHDWRSRVDPIADSMEFFLGQPQLRLWLESGYAVDRETPGFVLWRRRS
jgi:hypothetical protein